MYPKKKCLRYLSVCKIMMYLKEDNPVFKTRLECWMTVLQEIGKIYDSSRYPRYMQGIQADIDNPHKIKLLQFEIFIAYNCKCFNQRFSYYIYRNIEDFYLRYPYLKDLNETSTISDKV